MQIDEIGHLFAWESKIIQFYSRVKFNTRKKNSYRCFKQAFQGELSWTYRSIQQFLRSKFPIKCVIYFTVEVKVVLQNLNKSGLLQMNAFQISSLVYPRTRIPYFLE